MGSFLLFCIAMLFVGGNLSFVNQYRFAAAESVETKDVGKAISFVLLGGILAGYLGPEIGRATRDWLGSGAYSGSFVSLAILYAIAVIFLLFLKDIRLKKDEILTGLERPLKIIVTQPSYLVAVWAGVVSYGVMDFIMTATPISMHVIDHFNLRGTALVIQSHIIAMFLPSLFTGFIVDRLGAARLMLLGAVGMIAGVLIAVLDHGLINYLGPWFP